MLPYDIRRLQSDINEYKFKLKLNVFSALFDIPKFGVQLAFIYENKEHQYPALYEPNDSKLNEKPFGKRIQSKHAIVAAL